MRIVSLTCSNTEIVCALGCGSWLVGVDNHTDYPVEVIRDLPRVGPDLQIDVRAVAALKPDLVLASLTVPGHERIVAALEREKLPFLAPEPISLADVFADIRLIGSALGVSERAEALVSDMQATFRARPPALQRAPRIVVEWWPKPVIVPGKKSWVSDLIALAGAVNPLGELDVKSQPLSNEASAELGADAVVISWCGVKTDKYRPHVVSRRPGWENVPAVKSGRIYPIPEAYLGRPGPRLVDGFRALCDVVSSAF